VTLHRVRLPLRQLYVSSKYVMNEVFRTVIEVETDDGRVGIGEAPGHEEVVELAGRIARSLMGRSPLERVSLQHAFASSIFHNGNGRNGWSAYGGLETALWDWAGHHFGVCAADLIGGRTRDSVQVACPVPAVVLDQAQPRTALPALFRDGSRIDAVVEYCIRQRAEYGFSCFKYKSAGLDGSWDVRLMRALRQALGPDVALRWDPNAAYPVAEATALCGRMEDLGLEFYEDPTDDISGMASLRSRVRTPLATNMCVIQLDHLASAIRRRPADVLLVDVYMWGGIENLLRMAATADAYGFQVGVHSFFETGIGTAVNLHLAAALPQIRYANDCGYHVLGADVLRSGTLETQNGRMHVPTGPGWGVDLDRDAVKELSASRVVIEEGLAT
jgi:glucarate dehydratase